MSVTTAGELFLDELQDIDSAEKQFDTLHEERDTDQWPTEASATVDSETLRKENDEEEEDEDEEDEFEDEDDEEEEEEVETTTTQSGNRDKVQTNVDEALKSRDPEDRPTKNEQSRREKNLDKTLADSFPTSDPPSTNPDPSGDA